MFFMAKLTDIVKNLKGNYSSDLLVNSVDLMNNLTTIDTDTSKGLADYLALTGDKSEGQSPDDIRLRKDDFLKGLGKDIGDLVMRNPNEVSKDLGKKRAKAIGFEYAPQGDFKVNDEYDLTRKVISESVKIIKAIKQNPDDYFKKTIEHLDPLLQEYLVKNKDAYLQNHYQTAEESRSDAIEDFGEEKFVAQTMKTLGTLREKSNAEMKLIQEEMVKARKEARKAKKNYEPLTPEENVRVNEGFIGRLNKIQEQYKDVKLYNPLINSVMEHAYSERKSKKDESAQKS